MNEVFEKTRELGEALLRSEEYTAVKKAEEAAMQNEAAAEVVGKFLEARRQMEQMMAENDKDWFKVKQLTDEIDGYRMQMDAIEDLKKLDKARETFSELINQINTLLRFIVTGQMSDEDEGCSGSCESCSGCSKPS